MPAQTSNGPLNNTHKKLINDNLYVLNQLRDGIAKAKEAGIDVSELEPFHESLYTKFLALKRVYFPEG